MSRTIDLAEAQARTSEIELKLAEVRRFARAGVIPEASLAEMEAMAAGELKELSEVTRVGSMSFGGSPPLPKVRGNRLAGQYGNGPQAIGLSESATESSGTMGTQRPVGEQIVTESLERLEESFRGLGLSPEAARYAARGRDGGRAIELAETKPAPKSETKPEQTWQEMAAAQVQEDAAGVDAALAGAFKTLGLSESAAKRAVRGRD